MPTRPQIASILATVAACSVLAPAARALPPDGIYHLRPGSTVQDQCLAGCVCDHPDATPLRGLFILRSSTPDPVFQNYSLTNIQFRAPAIGRSFVGSGAYQVTDSRPGSERLSMDVSIQGDDPVHGEAGRRVYVGRPVIITSITLPRSNCLYTTLTLRATPLRSDWNVDGTSDLADLFAFLTSWFAGDADSNEDDLTGLIDVYDFLDAWFAGA